MNLLSYNHIPVVTCLPDQCCVQYASNGEYYPLERKYVKI